MITICLILIIILFIFITLLISICNQRANEKNATFKSPPSPFRLPILGHLHLLGRHQVPYEDFTSLAKKYGDIYALQLGYYKCVVINGQKNIREALVTKGHHFDSRPNFQRYHQLFSGNKENSLAFCNWSSEHKTRRDMLKTHTFPKSFTQNYANLDHLIGEHTLNFTKTISNALNQDVAIKPIVLRTCAAIFLQYFCSKQIIDNNNNNNSGDFQQMIENYDEIFYEVNQGYAADFLPFLLKPFHGKNLKRIDACTHKIRQFVLDHIIGQRFEQFERDEEPRDYVDSLIQHVKFEENCEITWEMALFALEDIIGGHSAVGNFLVKVMGFLAREPQVQHKIQQEIDNVLGNEQDKAIQVSISHRTLLPYTEAAILEAIRMIASPIVPRAANRDSYIDNFKIEKGTILFLNNHQLNMSEELWSEPKQFQPERFIKDGRLVKPDYFLPFGGGRRSCMGYKMVQLISFGLIGGLLQKFTIQPATSDLQIPIGNLALPKDTFKLRFQPR